MRKVNSETKHRLPIASAKHIGKVFLKILLWLLIFIVGLLVLIIVALQFPQVQHFAAQKGASYLAKTLDTRVEIGGFTTDWRNSIVLKEVYLEDQQQDTLWYSERLGVDLKIFSLLKGEINIGTIDLQNATAKVHIRPDSSANFDFIMEAFASDTTTAPVDTTATAMKLNLDVINLENIYLDFRDEAGGNLIKGRIGKFLTTMDELDLENEIYRVDEIELRNTAFSFIQTKLPVETEESEPLEMQFGLNRVQLQNIDLSYHSQVANQRIELKLGDSELVTDDIDIPNAKIDLKSFDLHNTSLVYVQEKYKSADSLSVNPARTAEKLDETVEETQGQPVNWVIDLNEMDISGLQVKFDNFNTPAQPRGMDYDHLLFKDVELNAKNFVFSQNQIEIDLNQLKLAEKSGFRVNNFQAAIRVDSTSASLTNLDLQTDNSNFGPELVVRYPSLDAVAENPELLAFSLDLQGSRIGMKDVGFFAPDLTVDPAFRKIANSTIRIDGQASGALNDVVTINKLQIAGLQGTRADVSGSVRNPMNPDRMYLNLRINQFATTRTDVQALSPPGVLPPDIRIPNTISMTGNYRGTLTNFDADANVRSSVGNITANVDMQPGPAGAEPFRATVNVNQLDLGQILIDTLGLGRVSMQLTASGTGMDPETMRAQVKANIREFNYNDYTYSNILANATINQNIYTVNATSEDQNLDFVLNADVNMRNAEQPAYAFTLELDSVDLKALNLYPDDLAMKGYVKGNFRGADASTISGTMEMRDFLIRQNQHTFPIDSLGLTLDQTGPGVALQVASNLLDANMRFRNSLATLPTALEKHFSNFFDLHPDPPYPADSNLEDFTVEINLKRTDLITAFVPDLEALNITSPITASYNGQTNELNMDAAISLIEYTDFVLKNLSLQVRGNREQLGYQLNLQELSSPALMVQNIALDGAARDNDISTRLSISENNGNEQFVIGGLLNSLDTGYRFSFAQDQLVINGDRWTVPEENYLQFDTNLLYANNIRLERGNSYLLVNSIGEATSNAPLQVEFANFDIAYLMESFQQEDSMIAGIINGEATIRNLMEGTMAFTSDITLSDLAYMGVPVGNIGVLASTDDGTRYNLEAGLTGNGNQLKITGFYEAQPNESLLNLDANIGSINLAALEGFTMGMVKDMGGNISGRLRITGTVDDPNISGDLNFNQAQFNVAMLNSVYRLQNERLVFNEQGINFPNFTLTDSLNNTMVVKGNILTQDYLDYQFDLRVNSDRFLAMNSTAQDNDLFYGTVLLGANAKITGDMAHPVLDLNVSVLDGSDFTAVIPADEAGAAEREGIVEFVQLNDALTAIVGRELEDSTATGFVGADINVSLKVTDATPMTIIIDPATGDNLVVRGNADPLVIGIQPSGQINMSGRYEITEGQYSMDFYDLVSRQLDIAEGSYIAWTGDPLYADVNITTIYNVRTAPMELLQDQAQGQVQPAWRNQLPFEVQVIVTGEIMKPEIGFDIELPEEERGSGVGALVTEQLAVLRQDENEMSKQVFSLLVLGRFMALDPLASTGGSLAASARGSLSSVMTDQLNALTDRYAGGLGLEVGVNSYEDYSSGSAEGRTDLNVAVRQQFLNDRLTVRVGTDIGIEGQSENTNSMSGFGGDVSVEYSITKDGRLRVRGFQRNQYEGYLEGDVRATGLSLIFEREYDDFADLFRNVEKRQEKMEERRKESAQKLKTEAIE
nr:translocation/assembly module TamB domain-containing protein [Pontibacter qinzhouensis]